MQNNNITTVKPFVIDRFAIILALIGTAGIILNDELKKEVISDSMHLTAYNTEETHWREGPIAYTVESPGSPTYYGQFMLNVPPCTEIEVDIPFSYVKTAGDTERKEHKVMFSVNNQMYYQTAIIR